MIKPLVGEYEESLKRASEFSDIYLTNFKLNLQTKTFVMVIGVFFITFVYIYAYSQRKTIYSLILSMLMFLLIVFSILVAGQFFNGFTVSVELCETTLGLYNENNIDLMYQNNY
jgi:energy-coupling factor transporter transmembrane protein EcfT